MNRTEAMERLYEATLDYRKNATFSRVSGFVMTAVTCASISLNGQPDFVQRAKGVLDGTLNAVEAVAPPAEAEVVLMIVYAARNLLDGTMAVESSGVDTAILGVKKLLAA